jgi:4-aminobutyrate aminotransferase-like enzyme
MDAMLQRGYIMLPSGVYGHVLTLTPPLVVARKQLEGALVALREVLSQLD